MGTARIHNMAPRMKRVKSVSMQRLVNPADKRDIYQERGKIEWMVKNALFQVLMYKPANPYEFLAVHFEWESIRSNPLKRACQLLTIADYRSVYFVDLLSLAYVVAGHCKVSGNVKGITGNVYMDLIRMLCSGLGDEEEAYLLENIYIPPKETMGTSSNTKALANRVLMELGGHVEANTGGTYDKKSEDREADLRRCVAKRNNEPETMTEFTNVLVDLFWRKMTFS